MPFFKVVHGNCFWYHLFLFFVKAYDVVAYTNPWRNDCPVCHDLRETRTSGMKTYGVIRPLAPAPPCTEPPTAPAGPSSARPAAGRAPSQPCDLASQRTARRPTGLPTQRGLSPRQLHGLTGRRRPACRLLSPPAAWMTRSPHSAQPDRAGESFPLSYRALRPTCGFSDPFQRPGACSVPSSGVTEPKQKQAGTSGRNSHINKRTKSQHGW